MRNTTFLWILGLLCSIVASSVWGYYSSWSYPQFSIESAKSNDSIVEIFFDTGEGFRADDAVTFSHTGTNQFNQYHGRIPHQSITTLRIDPTKKIGQFSIRSVSFQSGDRREILAGQKLLDRIVRTNDIGEFGLHNGIVTGNALSSDPYLVIDADSLSRTYSTFDKRILLAATAAFLAGTAFLLISFCPATAIISIFTFTILNFVQQKALLLNPLNTDLPHNYIPLFYNVMCGLCFGIYATWGLRRYQESINIAHERLTTFYSSIALALAVMLAGLWLDPIFPWMTLSLAAVVLSYTGGHLTCMFRQSIENLVTQNNNHDATGSNLFKWSFFIIVVWLIVDRAPSLLTDPRIWAEDGRHTLLAMVTHQGWDAVFWYTEYFRILSNIAGLLSTRIFDLESAAYVFTFFSLFITCIPFLLVLFGRSDLWDTPAKKTVVCLFILYGPMSQEIWLNVNGGHYYITLVTILLLAEIEQARTKVRYISYCMLLGVASLSGILPCVMTPLYWLRSLQTRQRNTVIAAIILTTGTIIQFILMLRYVGETPARSSIASTDVAGWVFFIKTILLPLNEHWALLGFFLSERVTAHLGPFSSGQLLLAGYLAMVVALLWVLRRSVAAYFVIAAVGLVVMTLLFGIGGPEQTVFRNPFSGNRYFYVPNVLLLIALITALQQLRYRLKVSAVAIVMVLFSTLIIANNQRSFHNHPVILPGLPPWSSEIASWRKDPNHLVRIWPYKWYIDFNKSP